MNLACLITGHRWHWIRCTRCGAWRGAKPQPLPAPTHVVHAVDLYPTVYASVEAGMPFLVVRQSNCARGNHIILRGYDPLEQRPTGRRMTCRITWVTTGDLYGVPAEHSIIGITPLFHTHDH